MDKKRARVAEIEINQKWCKGCTLCAAFCPKAVYTSDSSGHQIITDSSKCILCMLCVERCPDFALTVTATQPEEKVESTVR